MSYKCISDPEQTKCITGKACNHCNVIIHLEELSRDCNHMYDTLDKVYTLLLLQSKSIQTTFKD